MLYMVIDVVVRGMVCGLTGMNNAEERLFYVQPQATKKKN